MADPERLGTYADQVLAALEGLSPEVVQALGRGLMLADWPLTALGLAFSDWTNPPDRVTHLRTRRALRLLAMRPDEVLNRLAGSEDEPWRTIEVVLLELAFADDQPPE